jgi:CheY-like chemotaxis protein
MEEGLEIIGEARNAQEALTRVRDLQPDVVLMDLMWFGDETAGAEAIAQIKRKSPQTKVIAITAYRHLIAEARRAGAEAALQKGFSRAELVDLIRSVHELQSRCKSTDRTDRTSLARLIAGIGVPILGFAIVAAESMWGIRSLSIEKFLVAVVPSMIVFFFGVVFAGRYVDVISETTTYRLFLKILNLFRIKLPELPFCHRQ